jgi:diguanylate cyclase (GGDEF)-like protein/PAS domain S-box-containing protein
VPRPSAAARPPGRSGGRADAAWRTMTTLADSDDVFETFFERAEIGLALADLDGRYVRANPTYAALLGARPEDLVGVEIGALLRPDDTDGDDELAGLLDGWTPVVSSERQHRLVDGTTRWVVHGVTVVHAADGRPAWLAVSAQDITERRRAEAELRQLTASLTERAVRDPLTGLANRGLLEERLRAALARDGRSGGSTGVLFLDLDRFMAVNDEHGHAVGDAVLVAVAERLAHAVRPSDTCARLGGDEFVVLVEGVSVGELPLLADRLRTAVVAPLRLVGEGGRTLDLHIGVSIGEAVSHAGADDPTRLVARADASMYRAKDASRARPDGDPRPGATQVTGRSG